MRKSEQQPNECVVPKPEKSSIDNAPVSLAVDRNRMAWRAFYVLTITTLMYWFVLPLWFSWWTLPTTWLEVIGESYFWFATTLAAVIVSHMGFTSLPVFGRRGRGANPQQQQDEP